MQWEGSRFLNNHVGRQILLSWKRCFSRVKLSAWKHLRRLLKRSTWVKNRHVVWCVQMYLVPEWWTHQGKKTGGWSDAYRTSLWGQCYWSGLKLIWFTDKLIRRTFEEKLGVVRKGSAVILRLCVTLVVSTAVTLQWWDNEVDSFRLNTAEGLFLFDSMWSDTIWWCNMGGVECWESFSGPF